MLTLSTTLAAALGGPVQTPALLVEIGFSTPRRYSSYADLLFNGYTHYRQDIGLENLAVEAYAISGQLNIGNSDDVIGALVLSEGIQDKSIRIWAYDAAAPSEVVWLASAVGASAQIGPDLVSIDLRHPAQSTLGPRTFIDSAAFGTLLADGTVLKVNGQALRLERRN